MQLVKKTRYQRTFKSEIKGQMSNLLKHVVIKQAEMPIPLAELHDRAIQHKDKIYVKQRVQNQLQEKLAALFKIKFDKGYEQDNHVKAYLYSSDIIDILIDNVMDLAVIRDAIVNMHKLAIDDTIKSGMANIIFKTQMMGDQNCDDDLDFGNEDLTEP